jgi:SAM-dependent methyltransferase
VATVTSGSIWEERAEHWIRGARTPGHDAYWRYSPSFFDTIVPAPGRLTLEIGCGEGRVARDLARRGHSVLALDASKALVPQAQAADPAGQYLVADAARLPLADASVDLAVAYNSLMDVDDMPAAVAEAARVLQPGKPLCVCVTHPAADAGRFANHGPDAPFVIKGAYLARHRVEETVERDGLRMTFSGWRYPLEDYARALEAAGLVIQVLREPAPAGVAEDPEFRRWRRVPMFLTFRAVKQG